MNIYDARWNRAKALALDINRRKDEATKKFGKKAILLDDQGEIVTGELYIDDGEIFMIEGNCHFAIFEDNPEMDHGSHTTIKEIEKLFSKFEVYVPWNSKMKQTNS
jgi:hypothetical protein